MALGEINESLAVWQRCLQLDPHNDRLIQNLALVALQQRDELAAERYWESLTSLWVLKNQVFPESFAYLELLGLRSKLLADSLFERCMSSQLSEADSVSATETWMTLSVQSVVLRGLAYEVPHMEPLRTIVEEDLGGFLRFSLRSLLALTESSLFDAIDKDPPFHYDRLGVEKGVPMVEIAKAAERILLESGALQEANLQDSVSTLSDSESREEYDEATLSWELHNLNKEMANWILKLEKLLQKYPSKAMTFLVQRVVFSLDFSVFGKYYDFQDADLYDDTRDKLIQGYCAEVLSDRYRDPERALNLLSEIVGSFDRWDDANDCCSLARIFNECELIYMSRMRSRSSVNGLAKSVYLLKLAEKNARKIEARARILQELSEIETQEPGDIITTARDGNPETKRNLQMVLTDIRQRRYDQARMRLESLLKRHPEEYGALIMMAKITMEEAFLTYHMAKDYSFLEITLGEAMGFLRTVLDQPELPEEFRKPCQRMVWQINGTLAKARERGG